MASLSDAVRHHAEGAYSAVLAERLDALNSMDSSSPLYPGVAATLALTYERLGDHDIAVSYAYVAHVALIQQPPADESGSAREIRESEKPSTALNYGAVFMREAARGRLNTQRARPHITQEFQTLARDAIIAAWAGILEQRTGWRPHQHAINAAARLAMVEAVDGNQGEAFKHALGAIGLGLLSESPIFVQHTSGLTLMERLGPKGKAVLRGAVALGVAGASLLQAHPTLGERAQELRDKAILRVA